SSDAWPKWPCTYDYLNEPNECVIESKKGTVLAHVCTKEETTNDIDLGNYSDYQKVLRINAYVLRFIHNVRAPKENRKESKELDASEIIQSERMLIIQVQRENFAKEIRALCCNTTLHADSKLEQYQPFLDEHGV